MKTATVLEIKTELNHLSPTELRLLCLQLIKFKKENKELATYLLFEQGNIIAYEQSIKSAIDLHFEDIDKTNNLYLIKKSLRKILRIANKYIKYASNNQLEVSLLIYYCKHLKNLGIPIHKSTAILNLNNNLIKKIAKLIPTLHEDLQHDFTHEMNQLRAIN